MTAVGATAGPAFTVRRFAPLATPPAVLAFLSWQPALSGPTICPFALATGHACPLCGGTRAAAALLRGDWAGAWHMHPLIYLIIPLMAVGWVWWTAGAWREMPRLSTRTANRALAALGLLFLVVWVIRLATGTLPPI